MRLIIVSIFIILNIHHVTSTINLALGGSTGMSTQNIRVVISTRSSNAVDGDPDQNLLNGHCIETLPGRTIAWWSVQLSRRATINRFRIVNRNQNRDRFAGFSIFVTSVAAGSSDIFNNFVPVFHHLGPELPDTIVPIYVNDTVTGTRVYVFNNRTTVPIPSGFSTDAVLELCEVEVFGCRVGFYGDLCLQMCSLFCVNNICDPDSGTCIEGCTPGYIGASCDIQCIDKSFGQDCNETCYCRSGTCDIVSGVCDTPGCQRGWQGQQCNNSCEFREFGYDCNETCLCASGGCDRFTGECEVPGCQIGYTGLSCSTPCEPMRFGFDCASTCGLCANSTCDIIDGTCPFGCLPGGEGLMCVQEDITTQPTQDNITTQHTQENITTQPTQVIPLGQLAGNDILMSTVAGAVLSLFMVAIVIIGLIWFKSKRDLSKFRRPPTIPIQARYSISPRKDSTYASVALDNIPIVPEEEVEYADPRYSDGDVYESGTLNNLSMEDLLHVLDQNKKEDNRQLKEQFKEIPSGQLKRCDAAKKQENVSKNRFKTILPYDHSRVKLSAEAQGSIYINANFIDGVDGKKNYIACQGPKPTTINDHWQMIWQENVGKIVMLCNVMEDGKAKCHKYWPDVGRPLETRHANIYLKDYKEYACYIVRYMTISDKKTEEERSIVMFHYTQWNDYDVPDALDLVSFHRHLKTERTSLSGPLLVHCSAGAGRTGTFVAFDALLKHGKITGYFNVYEYASAMRKCRMNVIQTQGQYVFLHQALLEGFRFTRHAISQKQFQEEFGLIRDEEKKKNLSLIRRQYQDLSSEKPEYSEKDYEMSLKNEKTTYSKTKEALSLDRYRPVLHTEIDGRTKYINATFISTFTESNGFLVTKFHSADTVLDFWRLVYDHGADTIVVIGDIEDGQMRKWCTTSAQPALFGPFEISRISETNKFDNVAESKLKVCFKEMEPMLVKMVKTKGWFEHLSIPPSHEMVLKMTEVVRAWRLSGDKGPVLVMSKDGVIGCGIFTAVYNAVEQLTQDGEVDLYNIVRRLQVRRPELFGSFEEYHFCYTAVGEYLQSDMVYMNHDE